MQLLTRKVRIGIMCFLILVFCVTAPLVLFYTAGYRFDFQKREIKATGVLNIDAKPTDAIVYLNNVKQAKKLPLYLPNRAPGTYHIKITAPGYKTWEKDITIESKKTTYIKDIILFKEALPIQILENYKKELYSMSSSPSGKYLLLVSKNSNIHEIDLYDTIAQSVNSISRIKLNTPPTITWAPGNDFAQIKTKVGKTTHEQVIDVGNPNITPNFSFPTNSDEIDETDNYIISRKDDNLLVTAIEARETKTIPTQNVFYNSQTKEWLTWSPWEVWTIYPSGSATLLNRTGEKINFVWPLDNYGILLLASENKITGFNPGYYVTHELFNNGKIESISANIETRMIYFLGEVAGKRGVYELEY